MSASKQVEKLLDSNIELRRIYDALNPYDGHEHFCEFLDEALDNHNTLSGPHASPDFMQNDLEFICATGRSLAKQYVDQPSWHTPWLTRYLLDEVLAGQYTYLAWSAKWGFIPSWSLSHLLPSPYRTFVPPFVPLVVFVIWACLLYWLVDKEYFVASALLGAFLVYFYLIEKPLIWWRRRKNRAHFMRLANLLAIPLYEIRSSNYDPATISLRLEACEQNDLQVASIAFTLLKLHPGTPPILSEPHTP